jgi:hypothetical protein
MMKWLFGLLVLANVGLLMWGTWYRDPPVPDSPRPPVAAQKLKLLSEPGTRLTARAKTPVAAITDSVSAACYHLGPFASPDKARVAGAKLDGWQLTHQRFAEYETQGVAYRLYLPSFASREEAENQRRELTRLGFSDHGLITEEPGMENAISLGLFSVEGNAQARLQELLQRGVPAMLQTVPSVRPIYWLALSTPVGSGKIDETLAGRLSKEDWGTPGVALIPATCGTETPAGSS